MRVHDILDRSVFRAVLALSLAAFPSAISAMPVVPSTPVTVSPSAPTSTCLSPTVAAGAGVYLAAWIERSVAGTPRIVAALITPGPTMRAVVVTPLTMTFPPVAGNDVFVSSAFDGTSFFLTWPVTRSTSGDAVAIVRIRADGTSATASSVATMFTGSRIDVGCNSSGLCLLAGVITGTQIGIANESAPTVIIAEFMQGAPVGDPAVEWNGSDFQVTWTRLGTSAGLVGVQLDPAGAVVMPPNTLLSVSASDHAQIACDVGTECLVVAPHAPGQPHYSSVFTALTGLPLSAAVLPAFAAVSVVISHADVAFHGPSYLSVSESDAPTPSIEALFVPRTGAADATTSPITDPTEQGSQPAVASGGGGHSLIAYVSPNGVGGSNVLARFVPAFTTCMADSDCPSSVNRCLVPQCSAGVCGFQAMAGCLDAGDAATDAADDSVNDSAFDAAHDAPFADITITDSPTGDVSEASVDASIGAASGTGPGFRGSGCACSASTSSDARTAYSVFAIMGFFVAINRRRQRPR